MIFYCTSLAPGIRVSRFPKYFLAPEEKGGGIENYGTLNLLGGCICKNTVHSEWSDDGECLIFNSGAGILNHADADLLIDGCEIRDNTGSYSYGAGIYNYGTVKLKSGSVSDNSALGDIEGEWHIVVIGGGVYNAWGAVFTMEGGEISGNLAETDDGGAGIHNAGTLMLNGGKICNNTRYSYYLLDYDEDFDAHEYYEKDSTSGAVVSARNESLIIGETSNLYAGTNASNARFYPPDSYDGDER